VRLGKNRVTENGYKDSFWSNEKYSQIDYGDGYTTL
jgi:hypothetical protein